MGMSPMRGIRMRSNRARAGWPAIGSPRSDAIPVPRDISIIGFDNIMFCEYTIPRLSTIEMPLEELSNTAAKILIESIRTGKIFKHKIAFDCELILRGTT